MMILNTIVMHQLIRKVVAQAVEVTMIRKRSLVKILKVVSVESQMKNHRKKKINHPLNDQVKTIKNQTHLVPKRVNQLLKVHLKELKPLNQQNLLKTAIVIQIKKLFSFYSI